MEMDNMMTQKTLHARRSLGVPIAARGLVAVGKEDSEEYRGPG
jgi:hypothetical protein